MILGKNFAKDAIVKRHQGFTLVELLVVVAILGVLAAIAIPRIYQMLERARQKKTMADMRTLALAINSYATDHVFVPQVSGTAADLRPYLEPTYLKVLPVHDGWRRNLSYQGSALSYTVVSFGGDGVAQGGPYVGPTTHYDADIALVNGIFVQWPEGIQVR